MQSSILIAGVGGQGTLLASKIMGRVAIKQGYDVKVSEVHGMSQRGGSVVTYVKYSTKEVCSPIIDLGKADFLLGFELLEAYRNIEYLKQGGKIYVNTQKISPMPVIIGDALYPSEIEEKIKKNDVETVFLDARKLAQEAGNEKSVNVVLIGVFATNSGINKEEWVDTIKETVPEKFLEINLKAFNSGYSLMKGSN